MTDFRVQRTAPTVYLDGTGNAVNGFQVQVYLPEFDETHLINVKSLDPAVVRPVAEKLYSDRKALASIGEPSKAKSE